MTQHTLTLGSEMNRKDWDTYFIEMAILASTKSKDPSTKVGCVIVSQDHTVLSMGFNGFPRGVAEWSDWDALDIPGKPKISDRWTKRPEKYQWVEHAERNAVYNAAREGIALKGAKAYLNWAPEPCGECARALIQAGIVEIIGPNIPFGGAGNGVHYHTDENSASYIMLEEAQVLRRTVIWNKK